ncbi:MAG: hypothetical protein K2O15_12865 [Lachnospiraceae bacterium]|nr:hypothetical protein [Lachnospiraceae bacterium]
MKANIVKKALLCTLTAALLMAPATGVLAAGSGAGTKAVGGGSSSSSKSRVEEIINSNSGSESGQGSASGGASSVVSVPKTSSVAGVQSTVAGVYLATNVRGTAITTGLSNISEGYGLQKGEKPYARIYNMDAKKSHLAQACIDNAAASMGAVAGPAINVEIGKMASGKFSLLPAEGTPISLKVGIPKNFAQGDKTFAVVAVRPGGAVSVLTDTDTNPDTVTFDTTAGQAVYALIKY